MAVLAARKAEAQAPAQELLRLAQKLGADPSEIDEIADDMGVELHGDDERDEDWPFVEHRGDELGEEETSPIYHGESSKTLSTGEKGPALKAGDGVSIAFQLLGLISTIDEPTRVVMYRPAELVDRAEFLVHRGRVLLGIRLDGELFVDECLEAQGTERMTRYQALARQCWAQWDKSVAVTRQKGSVSSREKASYAAVMARALLGLGQRAAREEWHTALYQLEKPNHRVISFSPVSLAIEIGEQWSQKPSETILAIDRASMCDEYWLLAGGHGSSQVLPIEHGGGQLPSFEKMRAATEVADQLLDMVASSEVLESSMGPVGLGFLSDGEAWGALVDDGAILLTRTPNRGLGQMLRQFQTLTSTEDR